MRRAACLAALAAAAACGGGDGAPAPPDASPDAPAAPVVEVSCGAGAPIVTFTTSGGEYFPTEATIAAGQIARWQMSAGHTAHSLTSGLFAIGQGEEGCYRFLVPGEYGFYCQVHGFTGRLVVE